MNNGWINVLKYSLLNSRAILQPTNSLKIARKARLFAFLVMNNLLFDLTTSLRYKMAYSRNSKIEKTFSETVSEMISKEQIISIIFLMASSTPLVFAAKTEKCDVLNSSQIHKSCSVCFKYLKNENRNFQGYRIRVACYTLSLNNCCKHLRLEVSNSESNILQNLRHLNHGIDLI